LETTVRFYIY